MGYMEKVSEKIRELRIANNISQEKFALKIGMDRTYYSGIENGKHNITLTKLKQILDGLNVKISDFFISIGE